MLFGREGDFLPHPIDSIVSGLIVPYTGWRTKGGACMLNADTFSVIRAWYRAWRASIGGQSHKVYWFSLQFDSEKS